MEEYDQDEWKKISKSYAELEASVKDENDGLYREKEDDEKKDDKDEEEEDKGEDEEGEGKMKIRKRMIIQKKKILGFYQGI